ncbi:biotin--[acetyl-CoA-carboxylase] ligase [Ilyomonas limi]|uniref:Biotin--[acetyl-CoA-carboxylase] ligase n=2 Tax=Ilyomonas limi TaxID=2575867 RepID=A0A4U3KW15_9BACT|nr:biotin--[acetyl-CoA-carboxylase] ligase [Ilyomonas limi]
MAQALQGTANHGHAWFAWRQTAGKGSRGKSWNAADGQNIILSVLLSPSPLISAYSFYLSAAVALAVYDFFKSFAGDETTIKWPNDIYWRDRKAAGILVENNIRGNTWQWAVAGMGVNINQTAFNPSLSNPVSLKQITGKTYDVIAMAKILCGCLQIRYQQMQQNKESILEDYNAALYKKGEMVKLKKNNAVFSCTIKGVNAFGQLEIVDAPLSQVEFGEVEWVIK